MLDLRLYRPGRLGNRPKLLFPPVLLFCRRHPAYCFAGGRKGCGVRNGCGSGTGAAFGVGTRGLRDVLSGPGKGRPCSCCASFSFPFFRDSSNALYRYATATMTIGIMVSRSMKGTVDKMDLYRIN